MRTTVTLDAEVVTLIQEEMERTRLPFKQVLNQAVRRGLRASRGADRPTVRVRPHDLGTRPGVVLDRINQLADELVVLVYRKRLEASP